MDNQHGGATDTGVDQLAERLAEEDVVGVKKGSQLLIGADVVADRLGKVFAVVLRVADEYLDPIRQLRAGVRPVVGPRLVHDLAAELVTHMDDKLVGLLLGIGLVEADEVRLADRAVEVERVLVHGHGQHPVAAIVDASVTGKVGDVFPPALTPLDHHVVINKDDDGGVVGLVQGDLAGQRSARRPRAVIGRDTDPFGRRVIRVPCQVVVERPGQLPPLGVPGVPDDVDDQVREVFPAGRWRGGLVPNLDFGHRGLRTVKGVAKLGKEPIG